MARFRLTIEYQGTRYRGWQAQKNAPTVAGSLTDAIRVATGAQSFELYGAGRTDAGVHALAQVAHLQTEAAAEPEEKSARARIERVELAESGALILIRIEGSHFLWKMVRRMVGVIVEAGRRMLALDAIQRFLETESDEPARLAAPASGLFLE